MDVPNVVGFSRDAAEDALRDAGLRPVVVEEETDDPDEVDQVLRQSPGPGAEVDPRSEVEIVVGVAPATEDQGDELAAAGHRRRAAGRVRVAVLAGGRSSEHEISLASAAAIRAGLEQAGHEPVTVEIAPDGRWSRGRRAGDDRAVGRPARRRRRLPGAARPVRRGRTVQGLLELADVPYVGAGVLASALCMDKVAFKDVMAHAGIPQVAYRRAREGDDLRALEALGLPVFVKPARLGSSVGISKAGTADELRAALEEAWRHDPLAIVEALSRGHGGRVLGDRQRRPGGLRAGRARGERRVVRLRGEVPARRHGPGGAGAARGRDPRAGARARRRGVQALGLRRARPGRLLRRGRRPRARQRAEHDARLHRRRACSRSCSRSRACRSRIC